MYKIAEVKIDQFWHRFDAECTFTPHVNVIIGKNGTGKTTFMNILSAALFVDLDVLSSCEFESIVIIIESKNSRRRIKVNKIDNAEAPFMMYEYQISRRKYLLRYVSSENRRMALHYRRRAMQESEEVRDELKALVSLSILSVYRLRSGDDYEIRDRAGTTIVSPVDYRLTELLRSLTHYQLELSQNARVVANKLQKEVLASILYGEEDSNVIAYNMSYNKEEEKRELISAYARLSAMDADIRKRIGYHVDSIEKALKIVNSESNRRGKVNRQRNLDIRPLEAMRKTRNIIEKSLEAEKEIDRIFAPLNRYLKIVRTFIQEKEFEIDNGDLTVKTKYGKLGMSSLSSGEKQLLILLTEALLQRERDCVFLADEPELSLHIEWQRKVLPAIRELNANAQIIVATHSPEVASKFKDSIIDMEDLING